MEWFAVAAAMDAAGNVTNPVVWMAPLGSFTWMFRRGTWQRMLCKRIYKILLPIVFFNLGVKIVQYVIEGNWPYVGLYVLCIGVWTWNYFMMRKFDNDDDDNDSWQKLKAKVRGKFRLRVRRLIPTTVPR